MRVQCLLWDFGDPLCRETFIWSSGLEWEAVYQSFDDGWANDWNTAAMDTAEFARAASRYIPLSPEDIGQLREAHRLFVEMGARGHAERVARELDS